MAVAWAARAESGPVLWWPLTGGGAIEIEGTIPGAVSRDFAAVFQVATYSEVIADWSAEFDIAQYVMVDFAAEFDIRTAVQQDFAASFNVETTPLSVAAEFDAEFDIRTAVEQDFAAAFNVTAYVSQDFAASFKVYELFAQRDFPASLQIRSSVTADFPASFAVVGVARSTVIQFRKPRPAVTFRPISTSVALRKVQSRIAFG